MDGRTITSVRTDAMEILDELKKSIEHREKYIES